MKHFCSFITIYSREESLTRKGMMIYENKSDILKLVIFNSFIGQNSFYVRLFERLKDKIQCSHPRYMSHKVEIAPGQITL